MALSKETIIKRNNIKILGQGRKSLIMAHGFGCSQQMWKYLTPYLEDDFRIILFDYVGSGNSQLSAYSTSRYSDLEGYAQDILEICDLLELEDAYYIGHSVSGIIGLIAANQEPGFLSKVAMVCPSPCFLNDPPEYYGGFDKEDLEDLIDLMDKNYLGWANYLAPLAVHDSSHAEIEKELSESFCNTDQTVARTFARATFFLDYRHLLPLIKQPALIIQTTDDPLAPVEIGRYMDDSMPNSRLEILNISGHVAHMTHPELVAEKVGGFF